VAQPSISTTLSQLEGQLGVPLFVRHRKGVTPTSEARVLYASAIQLLGEFDALRGLFKKGEAPLPLTLAVMPTIDGRRMEELFGRMHGLSERLELRLVEVSQEADARIIAEQLRRKNERFIHLWDERYVLALPLGHRLTLQGAVTLHDLQGVRFIERCLCEIYDDVMAFLKKHGITPVTVARANNEEWAAALVAAGVGVAVVPESSVRGRHNVATRPIEGLKVVRKVGLAYDPGTEMSAGLRLLIGGKGRRGALALQ
jgi:DNA-binding transcriptional LysR family regulator